MNALRHVCVEFNSYLSLGCVQKRACVLTQGTLTETLHYTLQSLAVWMVSEQRRAQAGTTHLLMAKMRQLRLWCDALCPVPR
jgi:hypothetical protein